MQSTLNKAKIERLLLPNETDIYLSNTYSLSGNIKFVMGSPIGVKRLDNSYYIVSSHDPMLTPNIRVIVDYSYENGMDRIIIKYECIMINMEIKSYQVFTTYSFDELYTFMLKHGYRCIHDITDDDILETLIKVGLLKVI